VRVDERLDVVALEAVRESADFFAVGDSNRFPRAGGGRCARGKTQESSAEEDCWEA